MIYIWELIIMDSVEQALLTPSVIVNNQPHQQLLTSKNRFKIYPERTPFTMALPWETHYHKLTKSGILSFKRNKTTKP